MSSADPSLDSIVAPLRGREWQVDAEARLQELVEISSHSADRQGCQAALAALSQMLSFPGVTLQRHPDRASRHGDHLSLTTSAGAAGPFVLLIGHLDTVFPKGSFDGYRVSEEGGVRRAHGPGVYDMKGGLVCIAFALRALSLAGILPRVPLRLIVVSDEEVGSPSGREAILEVAPGAAYALGFESGRAGDAIITRRKGIAAFVARASGRAAHAGNLHHEGKNAIWALARFVDAAQGLTDYGRGVTINVGKIEGGQGRNTVPDWAEALIDLRFVALSDAEELQAALVSAAASTAVPGTSVELTGGVTRHPLERSEAQARLLDVYSQCQRAAGLGASEAPLLGGGSDASTVGPLFIPAIDGLGPRGGGFHTMEERVELATILQKSEALVRFLLSGAVPLTVQA